MPFIDLLSDTLTLPTPAMREAMYKAEVGDSGRLGPDGRGEDPTVNRLEDRSAEVTGKEAALFFQSGTGANLAAILTHCGRGDTVACDPDLHVLRTEKAAFMDRFGGLKVAEYERDEAEMPDPASFAQACARPGVRLACIENTHNQAGGTCITLERTLELADIAKKHGMPVHLDGARLFNAAVALSVPVASLAAGADSVQFCLSKGLGAPVGSVVCGSKEFIAALRDTRKILGGVMRQAGILAAAGLVALDDTSHLAEDHENAKLLGAGLAAFPQFSITPVQTNIVMLDAAPGGKTGQWLEKKLLEYGVRAKDAGGSLVRLTVHRDLSRKDIETALAAFHKLVEENKADFTV